VRPLLILRPQPGAGETAARAQALGLAPIVAPLFMIRPLSWVAPDPAGFDAVMLTSANAARHAGDGLTPFLSLPCYAVGEASAAAAREAGFAEVRVGPADGDALAALMVADGVHLALHPCGADFAPQGRPGIRIDDVPVYAADGAGRLPPEAEAGLRGGALALLHSPRAASWFAMLVGDRRGSIAIAAISAAAARAAGTGWEDVAVAAAPRDEALLELAAKLCQTDGE